MIHEPPTTLAEWLDLPLRHADDLLALGCRRFGRGDHAEKRMLWLYPKAWYAKIPDGFQIVDIFFDVDRFVLGETSGDERFGMLAFGFLRKE